MNDPLVKAIAQSHREVMQRKYEREQVLLIRYLIILVAGGFILIQSMG